LSSAQSPRVKAAFSSALFFPHHILDIWIFGIIRHRRFLLVNVLVNPDNQDQDKKAEPFLTVTHCMLTLHVRGAKAVVMILLSLRMHL
jgi:hypothetical protein